MRPDDSLEHQQRAEDFTLNAFEMLPNRLLAAGIGVLPESLRRKLARAVNRYHQRSVEVTCELTTISKIIEEHDLDQVDYLKLDAEGVEVEALQAIQPQHWSRIRQIAVETHFGEATRVEVVKILERHDFSVEVDVSPSSPTDAMVYGRR
jgi:hypothetical protein